MENNPNTPETLIDSATGAYHPLWRRRLLAILGIALIAASVVFALLMLIPNTGIIARNLVIFNTMLRCFSMTMFGISILLTASNRFGSSVLHVYDSHLIARGLYAKNEIRIEYWQISSTKLVSERRLHIQLGKSHQFMALAFLFNDKNAAHFKHLIDEKCQAAHILRNASI